MNKIFKTTQMKIAKKLKSLKKSSAVKCKSATKKLSKVSKNKKIASVALLMIMATSSIAIFADWGPSSRITFDYNTNRDGSLVGPVFNSYINTPSYGDERDFTTINDVNDATQWKNTVDVDGTDETETILVRAYVHNNGNETFNGQNGSSLSIAKDTKVRFDFARNEYHNKFEVRGYVEASNATPAKVWDGAYVQDTDDKFKLEYVPGSAKFYNNGTYKSGVSLGDGVVTSDGVLIGSNDLDGNYLGCFDEAGEVYIRLKVVPIEEVEENPAFTIKKYVNSEDAQDNPNSVSVGANVPFDYKVIVANTGDVDLKNVKAWDNLPAGVEYIDNTLNFNGNSVAKDEDFFDANKGVTVTNISVGNRVEFTFKAKITVNEETIAVEVCEPGGKTFYNNVAKADPEGTEPGLGEKQDPAVVDCTTPKDEPGISIDKQISKGTVAVGEEFTYSITVTNTGNVDLVNAIVSDPAPINVSFMRTEPAAGIAFTYSESKIEATIASLKVGESKSFNIIAKVKTYVSGQFVNNACVNAPEVNPENPNKPDDCDDVPVETYENCEKPGKEHLPKDSPYCADIPNNPCDTPEKVSKNPACRPTETPSTGAGSVIATVLSAALVGAGVFLLSRKLQSRKS